MKKAFLIILVALTFIAVNSEFHLCEHFSFSHIDDDSDLREDYCRVLSTSTDKTHCCYFRNDTGESCKEISDDAYENIKRYKKYLKNFSNTVKIKCSSEYLSYSLFALIALLI